MAVSKKFWIYIGVVALALLLAVGITFGVMYLRPGTTILGLKYVSVNDSKNYEYKQDTEHSIADVDQIYVETERSHIIIAISGYEDVLNVVYSRKYSGFTRDDGSSSYDVNVLSNDSGRTFKITTTEKYSGLTSDESYVYVYLPNNYDFSKLTAISSYGNIKYSSGSESVNLNIDSVYLSTSDNADIYVGKIGQTNNYSFKTGSGDVIFNNTSSLSADKVEFETVSGSFVLKKSESGDCSLTTTDKFVVRATGNAIISMSYLNSDLDLTAQAGEYTFTAIGDNGNEKNVYINANNIRFNSSRINGYVSLYDNDSTSISNTVTITTLVSNSSDSCIFNSGRGSVKISNVQADVSVSSTSGDITLLNVSPEYSVYAYSGSGNITVKYLSANNVYSGTQVKVLSKTGNIDLSNISGALFVDVLEDSSSPALNVTFNAVHNTKNGYIKAKNRQINLGWVGNSDSLICRLYTTSTASFKTSSGATSTLGSEVNSSDILEYDLSSYATYNHQYRIGYEKKSLKYANAGRLFVSSTRAVSVTITI